MLFCDIMCSARATDLGLLRGHAVPFHAGCRAACPITLEFRHAYPAPTCAPLVLQLSQAPRSRGGAACSGLLFRKSGMSSQKGRHPVKTSRRAWTRVGPDVLGRGASVWERAGWLSMFKLACDSLRRECSVALSVIFFEPSQLYY